jgi:hypothetical protein
VGKVLYGTLKEIVGALQNWDDFCVVWGCCEPREVLLPELVDVHNGSIVAAAVAIVGCGEDREDFAVVAEVVAGHH